MSAEWGRGRGQEPLDMVLAGIEAARARGDIPAAVAGYRSLLARPSAAWQWYVDLAQLLQGSGEREEATAVLREGSVRHPGNVPLLNSLGLALHAGGRIAEAIQVFTSALRITPAAGALLFNLANAMRDGGDLKGALGMFVRAIEAGPAVPEMFNNLGLALQEAGSPDHARSAFRSALDRDPGFLPAALNLGYLEIQERDAGAAIAVLGEAVRRHPQNADAHWLLSHALLVHGDLERGWKEYEWRWEKMRQAAYRRKDATRQWDGGPLEGRRILLYAEQGLGDAIQFLRYVPMVVRAGGVVIVECQPALVPLVSGMPGVTGVYARGEEIPACDVECPLMTLPLVFGTTVESIPREVPYLMVDPERAARWRAWCAEGVDGFRVGVVWAGNPGHRNDAQRSLPVRALAALGSVEGVRLIGLQKGEVGDVRLAVPAGVIGRDAGPLLGDLAETAALIAQLDLVVTVDTAVAHLAGALGRPVWVLVPFVPDWRWMHGRGDTPWYPTARLFRQEVRGNWDAVIANAVAHLRLLAGSR